MTTLPEQAPDQAAGRFELEGRSLREHAARGTVINTVFLVALSVLSLAKGALLKQLYPVMIAVAAAMTTSRAETP